MIKSEVVLSEKGCVLSIQTTGHALSSLLPHSNTISSETKKPEARERLLALCTAISTVEQQFFYALKELVPCHPDLKIDAQSGSFQLSFPTTFHSDSLSQKATEQWKTLSQSFIIGYKMIEETYGRSHFQVTWNSRKEVSKEPASNAMVN